MPIDIHDGDDTEADDSIAVDNNVAPIARQTATPPTKQQLGHVADAIEAEVLREAARLGKAIKSPKDRELLVRVVAGAARLRADEAASQGAISSSLRRRRTLVNSQLADLRAFATEAGKTAFWNVVDRVFDRLTKFALAAVVGPVA